MNKWVTNFEFCGLNEKIEKDQQIGFVFNETVKLTRKIDSILSIINICYYLKIPIPIMHRQFLKIITQNPE